MAERMRLLFHFRRFLVVIGILIVEKVDTWQFDVKFHLNFDMFVYKQRNILYRQNNDWFIRKSPGSFLKSNIFCWNTKEHLKIYNFNFNRYGILQLVCICQKIEENAYKAYDLHYERFEMRKNVWICYSIPLTLMCSQLMCFLSIGNAVWTRTKILNETINWDLQ